MLGCRNVSRTTLLVKAVPRSPRKNMQIRNRMVEFVYLQNQRENGLVQGLRSVAASRRHRQEP